MQTKEAPMQEAAPELSETKHRNWMPWLIAVVVVLGLVAVGLVIWASDDDAADPQLETVTELVDTLHEGLNERDADTVSSVFTADATVNGTSVSTAYTEAGVLSDFERATEVTRLGAIEPGSDYYIVVQQFVAGVDDDIRAPLLIELDGDLMASAEWVPDFFFLTD
jgi:hypothetical protein